MTPMYFKSSATILLMAINFGVQAQIRPPIKTARDVDPLIVPTVTLPLGQVAGFATQSVSGRWCYIFHGIPYAQPPPRFAVAEPVEPWEGVLDATKWWLGCSQASGSTVIGDENCLYLSVQIPHPHRCRNKNKTEKLLPVVVHIHGGGFSVGVGLQADGRQLLDDCLVFVSINYRLGALGFLTTEDDVIPGNLGLKDQNLALKWVQEYIGYFGGDPDLVTLIGWSAGGASVVHHVTSPLSAGLFHRAIAASGSALNPWAVQESPGFYAKILGLALHCDISSSNSLLKCLREASVEQIVLNQYSQYSSIISFGPTTEPEWASASFQTQNPVGLLKSGQFNKVPFMSGIVEDEGIALGAGDVLISTAYEEWLNGNWESYAPQWLCYDRLGLTQNEMNEISRDIYAFYFGEERISGKTRAGLNDLLSDRFVAQGVMEGLELHSKWAPAFGYVVNYKSGWSRAGSYGYQVPATTHGDDERLVLGDGNGFSMDDVTFSRNFRRHLMSFALTGKPAEGLEDESWVEVENGNCRWHELDTSESNVDNFLDGRRQFWRDLVLHATEY